MNSYFDYFRSLEDAGDFFIGANTGYGFVSSVDTHIRESELSELYVLKGGCGCGKSTVMKKLCSAGRERGWHATRLICSSDPASLDGLVLERKGRRVAFIDGTSPHAYDPKYPGACSAVVDMYRCLDEGVLEKNRREIIRLGKEKRQCFERAYAFLSALTHGAEQRAEIFRDCFDMQKADALIDRLATGLGRKKGRGSITPRRTLAFSCRGGVRIGGFDGAERKIRLRDKCCMLPVFMKRLADTLVQRGENIEVSEYEPFGIGEIYVPASRLLISPFVADEGEKTVSMSRFLSKGSGAEKKGAAAFLAKYIKMTAEGALSSLEKAGKAHRETEALYTPAVDFSMVDDITKKLISTIDGDKGLRMFR